MQGGIWGGRVVELSPPNPFCVAPHCRTVLRASQTECKLLSPSLSSGPSLQVSPCSAPLCCSWPDSFLGLPALSSALEPGTWSNERGIICTLHPSTLGVPVAGRLLQSCSSPLVLLPKQ